jgi:altronate hydrolase
MSQTVVLDTADNVAVAKDILRSGTLLVERGMLEVKNDIPRFHKLALHDISAGEMVIKYRQIIGVASQAIKAGEHVHVHNCVMPKEHGGEFTAQANVITPHVPASLPSTFQGYVRKTGAVGTRNYIGILTSVNCSASVAKAIERHFDNSEFDVSYPNVDGVVAFTHGTGCGMSKTEGFEILARVLRGYAIHPNFAGILLIGLGCEVMQIKDFVASAGLLEGDDFHSLEIQESGGTAKSIERGIALVEQMLQSANQLQRQPAPVSALKVALQCGGSDALSGITANPSLGAAMDLLVAQGGTAILSETPEIFGAEHLLKARAVNEDVAKKLQSRIDWWQHYASSLGAELNNNPSPGNKAGGLTTILEKSLGAQAKSGNSALTDVVLYGEPIVKSGLYVMDSPGYDPVSVTGQMASGANVVCFTTGRGSVYGSVPAPSLKLATNTPLFERMGDDMDINCGGVFDGIESLSECGERIYRMILATASGEKTCSEHFKYGRMEFTPWHIGAVM